MGIVYKAKDIKLKRHVALKFLHSESLQDQAKKARFLQEAQAAASINHPNICTVYEVDEIENQIFIVMEYLQGSTLKEKVADGPLDLTESINIVCQAAAGLQEAHANGIVHRDIKSDNILVTEKGQVKIMDFGLVKFTGIKDQMTQVGTTLGTVSYMSPQQARGEEVDNRADIWSLGVVFYEMVTGDLPFRGEYSVAVVYSILDEEPERLTNLRPDASRSLENIVGKALAKNPDDRFQTVDEMLSALKSVSLSDPSHEPDTPATHFPSFLKETEKETDPASLLCVARDQELLKLENSLASAVSGNGCVVFVTGDAGSGKTTLIQGFERIAQEKQADLVVAGGKCDAHTGLGDPYLPFRTILGLLTGDVESMWDAGSITKDHAIRLWNCLPDAVEAILDAGTDLFETMTPADLLLARSRTFITGKKSWFTRLEKQVAEKQIGSANSNIQQKDLFEQLTKVLKQISRKKPLLLLLDDLQWADAGSISLLFHLGRGIQANRILIVGAYRSTEVAAGRRSTGTDENERHPLESVVNEFKRMYGDIELPLNLTEGRHFVESIVDVEANRLGKSFRETLFRQTEGHALFTVELLRGMQDSGVLQKNDADEWIEGPLLNWNALPARIDAVIGERIARLPKELQRVLAMASIEGESFTAEIAARLTDMNDRVMINLLSAELDKRHHLIYALGIQRINSQRLSMYQFRHVLFQKYLYTAMDEVERAYLHEEVAQLLEYFYGDRTDEIAVSLARHFRKAGLVEKSLHYLIRAAEIAQKIHANEEVIEHCGQSLILLSQTAPSGLDPARTTQINVKLNEWLGDALEIIGRHDEARASFQKVLSFLLKTDIFPLSRLHHKIGKTFEVQRQYAEAQISYETAESILGVTPADPENDWWFQWIEIQTDLVWLYYWQNMPEGMERIVEKEKPVIEERGTPAQRAKFYYGLALYGYRRDRYVITEEIVTHSRLSLNAAEESQNIKTISMSRFLMGFTLLWKGDFEEAEEHMLEGLKLTEKTGDVVLQSRCLTYLTINYRYRGDTARVSEFIPRCEAVAEAGDMIEYVAQARAQASWLAFKQEDFQKAKSCGLEALKIWEPTVKSGLASSHIQWTALWPLIVASFELNETAEAVQFSETLLSVEQIPLTPESVKSILEEAKQKWKTGNGQATRDLLKNALRKAQEKKLL